MILMSNKKNKNQTKLKLFKKKINFQNKNNFQIYKGLICCNKIKTLLSLVSVNFIFKKNRKYRIC